MLKKLLLRTASWLTMLAGAASVATAPITPQETQEASARKPVSRAAVEAAMQAPLGSPERGRALAELFPLPEPPKGFTAAGGIAMDSAIEDMYAYTGFNWLGEGLGFLGFPYLSELAQRPEYRMITEIRAEEMTRKGVELTYAGDDDDKAGAAKIKELGQDLATFHVIDVLRKFAEHDGFFGRGHIYIDTGADGNPNELKKPLLLAKQKLPVGGLKGFKNIEPVWTYPNAYNSSNPLASNFFRPDNWFVQGQLIHQSRLLTGISREMPDLLKPAYSFAGLSLSQMAKPYVDNWLRTRQSVSDLIHSFSIMILLTDMQAVVEDGDDGEGLLKRLDFFNITRDNRGIFAANKDTEDVKNVAAPIAGLDKLQAQSQEQLASVSRTPLVKLLGVTPSGLNASSDGEIRVFYDSVLAWQERLFRGALKVMLDCLMLNRYGEIDPRIGFKFVPLWQLDEAAQASVRKTDADTDSVLVSSGVLHPEESRRRIANAPGSPYSGLDVADVPEEPEDDGDLDDNGDPAKSAEPRETERFGV